MSTIGGFGNDGSYLTAHRVYQRNHAGLVRTLERMATGSRINRGADDPAGLITSENLRSVLAALEAESRALDRTDHVVATADGALAEISDLLVEAQAKVVANANTAGLSDEERQANQLELDSIVGAINRIAGTTSFNGETLLDGTTTLSAAGETVTIDRIRIGPLGEGADAQAALDAARSQVLTQRGTLGAFSRHTVGATRNALGIAMENIAAAESAIRDADYGSEAAALAQFGLLTAASLSAMRLNGHLQTGLLDLLA